MKDIVLIVDTDADNRIATEALLRVHGLRVLVATDEARLSDMATSGGAAVIVLDLAAFGMSGLEVLRQLRARFDMLRVPPRLLVIADWAEPAIERLALRLGADAFLSKPVSPYQFVKTVEQLAAAAAPPPFIIRQAERDNRP